MATISIIIVSYNGLEETTAPCLESIFRYTPGKGYEVIVVDNNSSDGTASYLTGLMAREPRLKCVLNGSNRGFAGGNNDGIGMATGNVLVLLNSDTLVRPGWLEGLTGPLSRDSGIGLIGPVSNAVGNEQKIHTDGKAPESVIEQGLRWAARSRGRSFETEMLSFFCVGFRRDVLDRVGLLDEGFGRGFYEDDDYSLRVRKAGYRLVCAEDVFVYHKGGGSFGKPGSDVKNLLRENRRRLEKKHGEPHNRRSMWRLQLDLVEAYLADGSGRPLSPDLRYRIANRLKVVCEHRPGSPFKKLFLFWRLLELQWKTGIPHAEIPDCAESRRT
ncbi:MAG: glycosyltransferase family 2 protein [Desulfobacteraceae bacterium]|nr:glycosyltransferase family 2 protein [Desulfobacteraceae bacterium]